MPKFRKKPVVIEAWLFDGTFGSATQFMSFSDDIFWVEGTSREAPGQVGINTLEGEMIASPGDWIIKGVKGEFYPCKPDIFAATYDPAE